MRKILLLFLVITFTSLHSLAQDVDSLKYAYYASKKMAMDQKRQELKAEALATPHHLRLGVGIVGVGTPTYSLEYSNRVGLMWEVGASLSYGYAKDYSEYVTWMNDGYQNNSVPIFGVNTDKYYEHFERNVFGTSVFGRLNWLNRSWVTLYSSFGLTAMYTWESTTINSLTQPTKVLKEQGLYGDALPILIDIVPIGVRVGQRFFGYFEPFGYSNRGFFLMMGVGYRF